jgi:hypothetical protein
MSKGIFWKGGPCVVCWSEGSGSVTGGHCQKLMGLVHFVETEEISNFDSLGPLNLVRENGC